MFRQKEEEPKIFFDKNNALAQVILVATCFHFFILFFPGIFLHGAQIKKKNNKFNNNNNNNNFISVSSLISWPKTRLIGNIIFTTPRWTETFHITNIHTLINTDMSPRVDGLMSFSEKTRKSNHLQMLEQRQHLLLNYFKTLSVGPAAIETQPPTAYTGALPTTLIRRYKTKHEIYSDSESDIKIESVLDLEERSGAY